MIFFQISNPSQAIAYKMKSVWNSGKERFKVPIHLQFYYLWSAPITKFWINQVGSEIIRYFKIAGISVL